MPNIYLKLVSASFIQTFSVLFTTHKYYEMIITNFHLKYAVLTYCLVCFVYIKYRGRIMQIVWYDTYVALRYSYEKWALAYRSIKWSARCYKKWPLGNKICRFFSRTGPYIFFNRQNSDRFRELWIFFEIWHQRTFLVLVSYFYLELKL